MKIKLSGRIGAFVGGITLFVALSIGLISIVYSSYALIDSQKQSIMSISDEGAKRVQTVLKMRLDVLYEVGQKKSMNSMYWDTQRQLLTSVVDRLGYLDMGVVSLDGQARYVISGESTDLSDRDYIKKVLKGEPNVSNVIISKVTNSPVIMYAVPIMENDKVVGALIGRKDGASLNDITDELGVGERGYAFIVGADSTIYSHPNRDLVLAQTKLYDQINKDSELSSGSDSALVTGRVASYSLTVAASSHARVASLWALGLLGS
jgi:methyl-accepting chemotaxis protein